ncbi:hypothetical protein I3W98_13185, partial [Streptomyces cavourensis]|nr:hypothetical protein [Streptomyces cavourensis]
MDRTLSADSTPIAYRRRGEDTSGTDRATGRAVLFVLLGSAGVFSLLWAGARNGIAIPVNGISPITPP